MNLGNLNRTLLAPVLAGGLAVTTVALAPADAAERRPSVPQRIELPDNFQPEGITIGQGGRGVPRLAARRRHLRRQPAHRHRPPDPPGRRDPGRRPEAGRHATASGCRAAPAGRQGRQQAQRKAPGHLRLHRQHDGAHLRQRRRAAPEGRVVHRLAARRPLQGRVCGVQPRRRRSARCRSPARGTRCPTSSTPTASAPRPTVALCSSSSRSAASCSGSTRGPAAPPGSGSRGYLLTNGDGMLRQGRHALRRAEPGTTRWPSSGSTKSGRFGRLVRTITSSGLRRPHHDRGLARRSLPAQRPVHARRPPRRRRTGSPASTADPLRRHVQRRDVPVARRCRSPWPAAASSRRRTPCRESSEVRARLPTLSS